MAPRSESQSKTFSDDHESETYAITSLFGPKGYARAKREADNYHVHSTGANCLEASVTEMMVRMVENRPYFPLLKIDPSDEDSVANAARVVLLAYNNTADCLNEKGRSMEISGDSCDDYHHGNFPKITGKKAKVTRICGGLTNALFKVDLPTNMVHTSSLLVRIFGADGMIDRDIETANFARLCAFGTNNSHVAVVHSQLNLIGRFANGRVETWIPNMRQAHHIHDFSGSTRLFYAVAKQLARLHYGFEVPDYLWTLSSSPAEKQLQPTLWKVIRSWITELSNSLTHEKFQKDEIMELFCSAVANKNYVGTTSNKGNNDSTSSIKELLIKTLENELMWLQGILEKNHPNSAVAFAHNDLCAANILLDASIEDDINSSIRPSYDHNAICIIDYEYGSTNYVMYDIANFFCEHCGGNDNGIPNGDLFPNINRQRLFLREYLMEKRSILSQQKNFELNDNGIRVDGDEDEILDLLSQVKVFQMASNLIWGIWGIFQATGDVVRGSFSEQNVEARLRGRIDLDSFDNLRYGRNRLKGYWSCKEEMLQANGFH